MKTTSCVEMSFILLFVKSWRRSTKVHYAMGLCFTGFSFMSFKAYNFVPFLNKIPFFFKNPTFFMSFAPPPPPSWNLPLPLILAFIAANFFVVASRLKGSNACQQYFTNSIIWLPGAVTNFHEWDRQPNRHCRVWWPVTPSTDFPLGSLQRTKRKKRRKKGRNKET